MFRPVRSVITPSFSARKSHRTLRTLDLVEDLLKRSVGVLLWRLLGIGRERSPDAPFAEHHHSLPSVENARATSRLSWASFRV